jgi:hypothetical protein
MVQGEILSEQESRNILLVFQESSYITISIVQGRVLQIHSKIYKFKLQIQISSKWPVDESTTSATLCQDQASEPTSQNVQTHVQNKVIKHIAV